MLCSVGRGLIGYSGSGSVVVVGRRKWKKGDQLVGENCLTS